MARGIVAGLAALLVIGAASASFAAGPPYIGAWARADGKTKIRVVSCGAAVCARNTWVRRGVSGEKVGDRLILKVRAAGVGKWSGSAFDPQRSETYSIRVYVAGRRMTTRGCMMAGLVCESMGWRQLSRSK
jgi:uncharacterized protein (DUF2147 family)